MNLIKKRCTKCLEIRTFQEGTPRDIFSICGNCWNWEREDLNTKEDKK